MPTRPRSRSVPADMPSHIHEQMHNAASARPHPDALSPVALPPVPCTVDPSRCDDLFAYLRARLTPPTPSPRPAPPTRLSGPRHSSPHNTHSPSRMHRCPLPCPQPCRSVAREDVRPCRRWVPASDSPLHTPAPLIHLQMTARGLGIFPLVRRRNSPHPPVAHTSPPPSHSRYPSPPLPLHHPHPLPFARSPPPITKLPHIYPTLHLDSSLPSPSPRPTTPASIFCWSALDGRRSCWSVPARKEWL
jgi:hypothetical protein